MPLLIDAYNVLYFAHLLPDRYAAVEARQLCQLIDEAGLGGGRATVVCDGEKTGEPTRQTFGAVELVYAGGGREADPVIEELIEQDHAPRSLTVVSNDRRLQRAARRRRAAVMGSEEFMHRLAEALRQRANTPTGPEKPGGPVDAEPWLRKFDLPRSGPDPRELESETRHWLREFGYEAEDED